MKTMVIVPFTIKEPSGLITVCNLISMHPIIPMEDQLLVGLEYCGMTGKVTPTLSSLQR